MGNTWPLDRSVRIISNTNGRKDISISRSHDADGERVYSVQYSDPRPYGKGYSSQKRRKGFYKLKEAKAFMEKYMNDVGGDWKPYKYEPGNWIYAPGDD